MLTDDGALFGLAEIAAPHRPRPVGGGGPVRDLFAGPGGWEEGLRAIGHAGHVVGLELDPVACATAEAAGHTRARVDVAGADPADWAPADGLIASPPCPGFSAGGARAGHRDLPAVIARVAAFADGRAPAPVDWVDPRSPLTAEPMRWAAALRPRWVALEQVPAVAPVWAAIAAHLTGAGYSVWTGTVNAADYGLPQTRRRAVLLASRARTVGPPAPTHGPRAGRPWRPMADAIGWGMTHRPYGTLASARTTGGPDREKLGGSGARAILYGERDAGRWIPPDPAAVRADGAVRLELAECAALQGFRGGYPWQGTATARYAQVTNAVPPPLAAAILAAVV